MSSSDSTQRSSSMVKMAFPSSILLIAKEHAWLSMLARPSGVFLLSGDFEHWLVQFDNRPSSVGTELDGCSSFKEII